jgi:UTP-glucose-1-phosphate uridylyltransferase
MFKPLIEYIFENLYKFGIRRFCFVVGPRTKSVLVNHMKTDTRFLKVLKKRNLPEDK